MNFFVEKLAFAAAVRYNKENNGKKGILWSKIHPETVAADADAPKWM
jgi:hypothetical protein